MYRIAGCESQYRQFNSDGSVLRGEVNNEDIGVFQINEHYHLKESEDLGYDIYTTAGNIEFAEYLYRKEGLAPWGWSSPCWDK